MNKYQTDWIEIGKRYAMSNGQVSGVIKRTDVVSLLAISHPFTDGFMYWNHDGDSYDGSCSLIDEFVPVEIREAAAHERTRYAQDLDFLYDVKSEVISARNKFTNVDLALALTEEFGEVIKALMDQKQKNKVSSAEIYKECVQAAAMAMRLAIEGDPNFPKYSPPQSEVV